MDIDKMKQIQKKAAEKQAKEQPLKDSNFCFWHDDRGNIKFDDLTFHDYLTHRNGIYQMQLYSDRMFFIQVIDNVVKRITLEEIKSKILRKDYEGGQIPFDVYTKLIKSHVMSEPRLNHMPLYTGKPHRDNRKAAYYYFQNGFIEVNKEKIKLHEYSKLDGYIWESDKLDFNIKIEDLESDFKVFIEKVANSIDTVRSAIGYGLHRYKDVVNPKAIIFMDSMLSNNKANGGTGKTLICQSLGRLRNLVEIDGRRLDVRNRFAFEQVRRNTNLILLNDMRKQSTLRPFYDMIAGGMLIDSKHEKSFTIPFSEAPKIIATTNYAFTGENVSDKRRKHEVILKNTYNENHRPIDDFNKRFFDDWNKKDWNAFFNYMFNCVKFYFNHGLVEDDTELLTSRKITNDTHEKFPEFMRNLDDFHIQKIGDYYQLSQAAEQCSKFIGLSISSKFLMSWIRKYAELRNMKPEITQDKHTNYTYFRIIAPSQGLFTEKT